jgi:hypothetical protein
MFKYRVRDFAPGVRFFPVLAVVLVAAFIGAVEMVTIS